MYQRDRNLFSLITASFAVALMALTVAAQTPVPPASGPIQSPQIKSRPIPERSQGLEPGKVVSWSLRDAIMTALESNVDIQLERENVRLAEYDLYGARAAYDPSFTASLNYRPQRFPNTFVFSGTSDTAIITNTTTYNFGMTRLIERSGGSLQFDFNNNLVTGNRNQLSPQFGPSFSVNFTQPLKRNFKFDFNRRQIRIAKKQLDLSDATFRQRAIEIISRVQAAYWDLAFAIRDEEIQREAVKLAETQMTNNQRQVEVGTLAPIDVVTAATSVESRRIQVFQAMSAVAQAENTLKQLVVDGPDSALWTAKITPSESFEIQPVAIPLDEALRLARDNRPELKQLALQKEINATNIDFFRNQAKPQIDFVAGYTTTGTGGTPLVPGNKRGNCGSPIVENGVPICASVGVVRTNGVLTPGILTSPFVLSDVVAGQFVGGYGQALRNMFTQKFHTISFGVNINIPWKNRLAEANLGRAKEQTKQIDLQTRRQIQDIETQIRNDVQAIEFAKMRIEAARAQQQFAQQQLEGEEKRFAAGLVTTFFVLQRQNDLAIAKGQYIRALTDYNKLVAQLQRDIGTTLSTNNIEVKSEANPDGDKK
jgi:HAE1 family hydrophobic/amphiphilic exporter-1